MMNKEKTMSTVELLVGVWELVAYERLGADGERSLPFGPDPRGQLMYASSGHMSASISAFERPMLGMAPERLRQERSPLKRLKGALTLFKGAVAHASYAGRYHIEGETVVHHVSSASFADWVGTELRRHMAMDSGKLILTFKDGLNADNTLSWRRLAS